MKKLFIFILCFGTMPVWAANMCVKNDAVLVVLDPNIAPTSTDYNNDARTWSATFVYGTINGISGCEKPGVLGYTIGILSNSQSNVNPNGTVTAGAMCACKILFPVESFWINSLYLVNAVGGCGNLCAQSCATAISNNRAVRAGIFGNIMP